MRPAGVEGNGRHYGVVGGYGSTSSGNLPSAVPSAELYNPASGTFTATGTMTAARTNHTATLLADGRVLVAGGYGSDFLSSAELYDHASGTFVTTGMMTTARSDHAATLLANGKVLITGGRGDITSDSFERRDF